MNDCTANLQTGVPIGAQTVNAGTFQGFPSVSEARRTHLDYKVALKLIEGHREHVGRPPCLTE